MSTRVFTSPLFLGFDHLEQMLERASKASNGTTRHILPDNIEQIRPERVTGSRSRLPGLP